jgi:hypothetical protein
MPATWGGARQSFRFHLQHPHRLASSVLNTVQHWRIPQLSTFIFALANSAVTLHGPSLRLSSSPDVPSILSIFYYL